MKTYISILSLYNYDTTLFDNMLIPGGVSKEDVINNILMETGEFELMYPNPVILKTLIGFWSKKEIQVWERLYKTTTIDYDPISNLRRTEESKDSTTRDLGGTTERNSSTSSTVQNSGTDTEKEYINAFNEATNVESKHADSIKGSGSTDVGNVNSKDTTQDTGTVETTHSTTMSGSIGVVLTQQMIEAERRVSAFNIIDYIIDSFKSRFCILVY